MACRISSNDLLILIKHGNVLEILISQTLDTLNLDTLKLIRNIKKCEMKSANKPVL